VNPAGLAIGIVAIIAGLAIGALMLAFPGGLNPAYPAWIAMLAPLVFVLGGVLVCANALNRPAVVGAAFKALALCLLALVNWGAFFSNSIQCLETVSFFGIEVLQRYPSEADCQAGLRIILAFLDAVIVIAVAVFLWRSRASRAQ
jgi:hypothetical protein